MRQPKPFFRTARQEWFVKIDGKFHPLGTDKKQAWEKYHGLMAGRQLTTPETTVCNLIGKFLDWNQTHREPGTHKFYSRFLASFAAHVGPKLTLANLKAYHVTEWLDRLNGGDNFKNGAVRAIMRAFNWGCKQGHIAGNPVKGVERPRAHGRVAYITPDQWGKIVANVKESDPFGEILTFLRETGCRPQECRAIESRHFDRINQQIAFPIKESKGKRESRIIPLNDKALALITRLALMRPEGKLFLNRNGRPWTAYSLNCRCARLSKKCGFKVFPYAIRHSFVTDALLRGVDPITLAHIVGHRDATMILRVYQHMNLNRGHVRAALALATGETTKQQATA
jgi:integrase